MTPAACAGSRWPAAMLNLMLLAPVELKSGQAFKNLDVRAVAAGRVRLTCAHART